MGMFDEVICNHELFGVHKGETHQTKDLHCCGGLLALFLRLKASLHRIALSSTCTASH
jgi:hypothetical protein